MRKLLVHGEEDFIIQIPDDAKVTFGPWSPPNASAGFRGATERAGTLRVYKGTKATENVVAVFSGVRGFRDLDLEYEPLTTPASVSKPLMEAKEAVEWSELDPDEKEELVEMLTKKMVDRVTEPKDDYPGF